MPLTAADIIDIEVQLYLDRDADPTATLARDAKVLVPASASRQHALATWVAARRDDVAGRSPGEQFALATRLARIVLTTVGVCAGMGVAAALFANADGTRPINVLGWIAVAVIAQAVISAISLVGYLWWTVRGQNAVKMPLGGELRALLRFVRRAIDDRLGHRLDGDVRDRLRAVSARLRTRGTLYAKQEALLSFEAAQWLGVAFNVGLLVNAFRMVALSDLVFAWSTTLSLAAPTVQAVVGILAAPWSWLPFATPPNLSMVEATQFSRFGATFSAESGAAVAGQWWAFLLTATLFYGLAPRLFLLGLSRRALRRAIETADLDTPDVDRLVRRLQTPQVAARTTENGGEEPGLPDAPELPSLAPIARTGYAIRWGGFPGDDAPLAYALARDIAIDVDTFHHAGGRDYREDAANIARLEGGEPSRVAVVVEAFDEPDRAARRFLADLRSALGEKVPILVAVVDRVEADRVVAPRREDVRRWSTMVKAEGDPYIDVLPAGETHG